MISSIKYSQFINKLLQETASNNGLAPIDLEQFWIDQKIARVDPFAKNIPQIPLGIMMSGECVYDELGIEEDYWRYDHDETWRLELNKAYNDKSEAIVGQRLLNENPSKKDRQWPEIKGLADLFEAENVWIPGTWSWWLQESAHSEDELSILLDRVEKRLGGDLRSFILPENWDEEKSRLLSIGSPPPRLRGIRGPVTFATSIYGIERFIYLFMDNEPLLTRFRDTILRAIIEIADLLDKEAGDTPDTIPHGFWIADDNCYLMTPDMYETFGYPILKGLFDYFSPNSNDPRYQHSDSAMGHIIPILASLGVNEVNFGPTVMIDEIRKYMPDAIIHGQLAPFTFSRNEEYNILAEFIRDFEMSQQRKGVVFNTAGSINNGSRLTGMRLIMSAIQHFGRY